MRLQRCIYTGVPGCDLANPKIKLLFGAIMVPCYQTSELQTNPMSSDFMDSKTCSHEDMASSQTLSEKNPLTELLEVLIDTVK